MNPLLASRQTPMKVDGALTMADPLEAGAVARRLEVRGYAGAFSVESQHDAFLPLAVAASCTERIELTTAIAVAFARSPLSLAQVAYDLQLASRGRFRLGLGSQVRAHVERRYGSAWGKPVTRMRECVGAIRAIWDCWQRDEKLDFRGQYYTHTLMTPVFNPGPNPHGLPPILLAAVGPRMTQVAGEVADGLLVHPFHTEESLREITLPAFAGGLRGSERRRSDVEISCQVILAVGESDEEIERVREQARAQIAFYASTPAYRPVLECQGVGGLQAELNALSKCGDWVEMAGRIDDDLLQKIAVVGGPRDVASQIWCRYAPVADRVSFVAPPVTDPGLLDDVVCRLADQAAEG